jgi:hypothetical protein
MIPSGMQQLAARHKTKRRRPNGTLVKLPTTWKPSGDPTWIERRGRKKIPHWTLGDAACSTSPRWVRGGVGFLIGSALGAMVGGGIALAVTTASFEASAPVETLKRIRLTALIGTGVMMLGGVGGLVIGAANPEC